MKRSRMNSRIEVWDARYINHKDIREDFDKEAKIVQIENGSRPDQYLVEILDNGVEGADYLV